jgi:signal transduction histidine kinase
MQLHEFMTNHRHQVLELCRERLRQEQMTNHATERDLATFFDEIVEALHHHDGWAEAPPPQSSAAARVGERQHRAGLHPAQVPEIFGVISRAIGQLGERQGLAISAEEYGVFNRCVDAGVATSIANFWEHEKARREQRVTEHFGYLAHELRIAAGNAALAFKLLRMEEFDMNGRTASVLANNLMRMETLVARTLGTVQLDAATDLELRPIRVANVLRRLQASAIPDRAVSIALELDDSLHVNADEMLLTSAVSNLLHNAIKFTRSGGHIILACRADEHGVLIEVEDECGGLPPGDPLQLLEPFVRRGDHPQNFGLGLAITLRATAAMGGTVQIEDCPGHGCLFQLRFPVAVRSPSSYPPPPPSE